jgi:hypothetical protein
MFYKVLFTGLLSLGLFASASAQTYWLNIVVDDESMSLPVSSNEMCSEAIVRYVQLQYHGSISCDVMPLPDAVNIGK